MKMNPISAMNSAKIARFWVCGLILVGAGSVFSQTRAIPNPVIWADVPDVSMVRVDDTYYMVSTTMHMSPGAPIMASKDLVNWKIINYVYSTLANTDEANLNNGKNDYGRGSWAANIRYKDGTFYVLIPGRSSGRTHLFSTRDIVNGPWSEVTFNFYHDPSLVLDDNGKNYIVHGGGDIRIVELNAGLTGLQQGGLSKIMIPNPSTLAGPEGLPAEGAQVIKVNGYYYVFTITWPSGSMRTVLVHRSRTIDGVYEGRVALRDKGVAQGSIIQAPNGTWYGYLFQDNGSVGRSPWILPLSWTDNWPIFGNNGTAPNSIDMNAPAPGVGYGLVTSDDFTTNRLPLEWQWNHNPLNTSWSLSARPGFLRITTSRVDANFPAARNSLTQRGFGPKSSAQAALETAGMRDGDNAGLAAQQERYGWVGVRVNGTNKAIVMINAASGSEQQVASVPLNQNRVHLRVDMDFTNRTDKATFFYSLDGNSWTAIGNTLQMAYTIPHFMGYRFALFNYATRSTGGNADFDWFKIGNAYNSPLPFPSAESSSSSISVSSSSSVSVPRTPYSSMAIIPGTIQAENYDVGGEGVAYHDSDPENSGNIYRNDGVDITGDAVDGYKVGWTAVGEWLEYTIRVDSTGAYSWQARVSAGGDGSSFRVTIDDVDVTGLVAVSNTESWDTYTLVDGITPALTPGQKVLRITVEGAYFNIDWIRFYKDQPTALGRNPISFEIQPIVLPKYDLLGRPEKQR